MYDSLCIPRLGLWLECSFYPPSPFLGPLCVQSPSLQVLYVKPSGLERNGRPRMDLMILYSDFKPWTNNVASFDFLTFIIIKLFSAGPSCSSDDILCKNRDICIDEVDSLCDDYDHCGDNSDESQCASKKNVNTANHWIQFHTVEWKW